jgi:hypothetical protein
VDKKSLEKVKKEINLEVCFDRFVAKTLKEGEVEGNWERLR